MSLHEAGPDCTGCRLKTAQAHPYMHDWFWQCVKPKHPDAHISWSFRDMEDQENCFRAGSSKLHWPHSGHNAEDKNGDPAAIALDLFEMRNGRTIYDPDFFNAVHEEIVAEGRPILWGAIWKKLGDSNHFQLKV